MKSDALQSAVDSCTKAKTQRQEAVRTIFNEISNLLKDAGLNAKVITHGRNEYYSFAITQFEGSPGTPCGNTLDNQTPLAFLMFNIGGTGSEKNHGLRSHGGNDGLCACCHALDGGSALDRAKRSGFQFTENCTGDTGSSARCYQRFQHIKRSPCRRVHRAHTRQNSLLSLSGKSRHVGRPYMQRHLCSIDVDRCGKTSRGATKFQNAPARQGSARSLKAAVVKKLSVVLQEYA